MRGEGLGEGKGLGEHWGQSAPVQAPEVVEGALDLLTTGSLTPARFASHQQ